MNGEVIVGIIVIISVISGCYFVYKLTKENQYLKEILKWKIQNDKR